VPFSPTQVAQTTIRRRTFITIVLKGRCATQQDSVEALISKRKCSVICRFYLVSGTKMQQKTSDYPRRAGEDQGVTAAHRPSPAHQTRAVEHHHHLCAHKNSNEEKVQKETQTSPPVSVPPTTPQPNLYFPSDKLSNCAS